MELNILHLYHRSMNIYGDKGNIIALVKRCENRNISVNLTEVDINEKINFDNFDLIFAGGGQDRNQEIIANDLQSKKKQIEKAIKNNKVFLLICGSYQLFGHYFQTFDQKKIPGISILDIYTIASNQRKIENVIFEINKNLSLGSSLKTIVGFENHSGNTFINKNSQTQALGKVLSGFGNNGQDKTEGAYYKNCFGTYCHGPFLPKNPHFTDYLIKLALENKYHKEIILNQINDNLEFQAHNFILQKRK